MLAGVSSPWWSRFLSLAVCSAGIRRKAGWPRIAGDAASSGTRSVRTPQLENAGAIAASTPAGQSATRSSAPGPVGWSPTERPAANPWIAAPVAAMQTHAPTQRQSARAAPVCPVHPASPVRPGRVARETGHAWQRAQIARYALTGSVEPMAANSTPAMDRVHSGSGATLGLARRFRQP